MPFVAVAGLGAVIDAILAIVILLAIVGVAYLVERFGSYIPVIGGWMAGQALAFLQLARDVLAYFYKGELWALQTVVNAIIVGVTWPLGKVLDVANVTVNAIYWLRNVAIPRALNAAYDFANRVALAAYAYALALYNNAIAFANQVALAAYAYALTLYQASVAFASAGLAALDARVTAAIAFTLTAITDLRAWVSALVGTAVLGLESEIAAVEAKLTALIQAYAAAALKDAITAVDLTAVAALTDIWPHLVTDVDGILAEIPKELIDIRDRLAAIPRVIPGDLLDALGALGVLAIPLLRYLRECGVPMCRDLHGLSDLFNGLNTVATDAALIGFFAECVHDPHAAADAVLSVVGPVAHGAATLTKELVGA